MASNPAQLAAALQKVLGQDAKTLPVARLESFISFVKSQEGGTAVLEKIASATWVPPKGGNQGPPEQSFQHEAPAEAWYFGKDEPNDGHDTGIHIGCLHVEATLARGLFGVEKLLEFDGHSFRLTGTTTEKEVSVHAKYAPVFYTLTFDDEDFSHVLGKYRGILYFDNPLGGKETWVMDVAVSFVFYSNSTRIGR